MADDGKQHRTFERDEPLDFTEVTGYLVLLDAELKEVTERQDCTFDWGLIPGGSAHRVTSAHVFDIRGKAISYTAVGG